MTTPNPSNDRLIRFPVADTKANYLAGFWRWVELLAADDYPAAVEALHWPEGPKWTAEKLKGLVTMFFGGNAPWAVVIPNDRLIGVVNDAADFQPGWFMAQIPLTTEPADPKSDEIPLMGLATSFFVREYEGHYVLGFEIFHA